jgi:hypothetical protein
MAEAEIELGLTMDEHGFFDRSKPVLRDFTSRRNFGEWILFSRVRFYR